MIFWTISMSDGHCISGSFHFEERPFVVRSMFYTVTRLHRLPTGNKVWQKHGESLSLSWGLYQRCYKAWSLVWHAPFHAYKTCKPSGYHIDGSNAVGNRPDMKLCVRTDVGLDYLHILHIATCCRSHVQKASTHYLVRMQSTLCSQQWSYNQCLSLTHIPMCT